MRISFNGHEFDLVTINSKPFVEYNGPKHSNVPATWYVTSKGLNILDGTHMEFKVECYTEKDGDKSADVIIPWTTVDELKIARIVARAVNTFLQRPQTGKPFADELQSDTFYVLPRTEQSREQTRKADVSYRRKQLETRKKALEEGDPVELARNDRRNPLQGAQTRRLLLRLTL